MANRSSKHSDYQPGWSTPTSTLRPKVGWARIIRTTLYTLPTSDLDAARILLEFKIDLYDLEIQIHQHRAPGT